MNAKPEPVFIIVDCETSGLLQNRQARPIEIGAIALDAKRQNVIDEFESMIHIEPHAGIAGALEVNRITLDELARAPRLQQVQAAWWEWLEDLAPYCITSFNRAFDKPMMARSNLSPPRELWVDCLMLVSMAAMEKDGALQWLGWKRDYKWPKLSEAAEHFSVTVEGPAHRALTDAYTTLAVLRAIEARKGRSE